MKYFSPFLYMKIFLFYPECGTTDIECESIQDLDTMGISETRIFVPSGHPVDPVFGCVVFEAMDDDETMPFITLAKKFASNAKKIRVTVDIIE